MSNIVMGLVLSMGFTRTFSKNKALWNGLNWKFFCTEVQKEVV